MRCHNCSAASSTFSAFTSGKLGLNRTGFILAIFLLSAPAEPTTTDAAITSCDSEPISWEYAPMKHHDTGVLLTPESFFEERGGLAASLKTHRSNCWRRSRASGSSSHSHRGRSAARGRGHNRRKKPSCLISVTMPGASDSSLQGLLILFPNPAMELRA